MAMLKSIATMEESSKTILTLLQPPLIGRTHLYYYHTKNSQIVNINYGQNVLSKSFLNYSNSSRIFCTSLSVMVSFSAILDTDIPNS